MCAGATRARRRGRSSCARVTQTEDPVEAVHCLHVSPEILQIRPSRIYFERCTVYGDSESTEGLQGFCSWNLCNVHPDSACHESDLILYLDGHTARRRGARAVCPLNAARRRGDDDDVPGCATTVI